jgi:pentatricopeptide repeat protein
MVRFDHFLLLKQNLMTNIGNNRMARRAVGVLQKMPAYRILPEEIHYTAAIWACEKSDQYQLAISVFDEMKNIGIARSSSTFEALISVAERTKHYSEAVDLFHEMTSPDKENIKG